MKGRPEVLEANEVISVAKEDKFLLPHNTFKVLEYLEELGKRLGITHSNTRRQWLDDGVKCNILSPFGDWRSGKIRIRLEFIPDSSPAVDEIRQGIPERNFGKPS
jgi:hypothetical protein